MAKGYEAAKQIVSADTAGDLQNLLSSAQAEGVPGAEAAADALKGLPSNTVLQNNATAVDGLVEVRTVVQRQILAALQGAITPADEAECKTSDLSQCVTSLLPKIDLTLPPEVLEENTKQLILTLVFATLGGLDATTYQSLYEGSATKNLRTIGEEQNKTKFVQKTYKDIKKFWAGDVNVGRIDVAAMKDDLVTQQKKADRYRYAAYALAVAAANVDDGKDPLDPREPLTTTKPEMREFVQKYGDELDLLLDEIPFLDDGESPLFSLNAYAYAPGPEATSAEAGLPKRLIFGNGMLSFLRIYKYGDAGTVAVLGHEFGHHIQYGFGFDRPEGGAREQTRHSELEADTLANYWSAHKPGGTFNAAEKAASVRIFANVGDCDIKSNGHHGTPGQRRAASVFGQDLALGQNKNEHVFSAESIRLKFNKELPNILAAQPQ